MSVLFARPGEAVLHFRFAAGNGRQRPIVFANSLGTDLRIWGAVGARLDPSIPTLAMDKRGHGLSDLGPADMSTHVDDLAQLMDHLGLSGALVCGVSVGGMIAQGLAAARPDLVAGLMLCNTGAKIGNEHDWNARIAAVREAGLEPIADGILERWFSPAYCAAAPVDLAGWRNMLVRTPVEGYAATCSAIRDADFTAEAAVLRVPTVCVAGADDQATPPDVVRKLADLIEGSTLHCLEEVGHLPCIEAPERLTNILMEFYDRLR
jgi:3-oxoadipate enol-lactonase